ncbi:hypothetical protein DH2020_018413 [Rehmannia glutinosa]|uniref:Pseudouridine synthase I TruA alpha/beta domain-containing protein n=1 Tax=Rehmannia glutinosa TaxID=99300 RepID=A0ABR0WIV0_REHGL
MIKHPTAAVGLRLRNMMESPAPPPPRDYVHYQHTDACSLSRWTAKESYQFMHARPWQQVNDFYLDVVNGRQSLSELFAKEWTELEGSMSICPATATVVSVWSIDGKDYRFSFSEIAARIWKWEGKPYGSKFPLKYAVCYGAEVVEDCGKPELVSVPAPDRTGRWARVTFRILLSYHGNSFDGWQKQAGLNTVQGLIERSLGKFVDEKKAQLLKEKKLPIEGCALVAGRTDKGVTALEQVCSFYTWRKDIKAMDIEDAINGAAPGKIRAISVSQVSREFHPNFSAKWRHYFYIFPFNDENVDEASQCKKNVLDSDVSGDDQCGEHFGEENYGDEIDDYDQTEQRTGNKPISFEVSRVNQLLQQLEGKLLSFRMFARDTKASRNIASVVSADKTETCGPPTECFVFHARAAEAYLLSTKCHIPTGVSLVCSSKVHNLHNQYPADGYAILIHVLSNDVNDANWGVLSSFASSDQQNIGYTDYDIGGADERDTRWHVALDGTSTRTMCVELVANRFLRKMVRVLVATAIREAAAGADEDALLKLMDATCRRATAPPAPPDGLCLVDVGYTEFEKKSCLIP